MRLSVAISADAFGLRACSAQRCMPLLTHSVHMHSHSRRTLMHVRVHAFQLNSLLLPHGTLSHAHMRTLPHSPPSPHKSSHCTQPLGTCIWLTKRARLCAVQDQHDLQDARACVLCWASMTHKTRVPVCCAGPAVGITRWPLRFAEWGLGTGRTGGVLA